MFSSRDTKHVTNTTLRSTSTVRSHHARANRWQLVSLLRSKLSPGFKKQAHKPVTAAGQHLRDLPMSQLPRGLNFNTFIYTSTTYTTYCVKVRGYTRTWRSEIARMSYVRLTITYVYRLAHTGCWTVQPVSRLGCQLDVRGTVVRLPVDAIDLRRLQNVQDASGPHFASYSVSTGNSYRGGKAARAWSWRLTINCPSYAFFYPGSCKLSTFFSARQRNYREQRTIG